VSKTPSGDGDIHDANDQRFDKSMVSGPETLEVFGSKVLKVGDRRPRRPEVGGIGAFASAREVDGVRGTSFEVLRAGSVKGLRICGIEGLWGGGRRSSRIESVEGTQMPGFGGSRC
jgi:hypothetical protein